MTHIAEATNYDEMLAVLRARKIQLGLTDAMVDYLTGLHSGYAGKLFGPGNFKTLGPVSMGPVLTVLGVKMLIVEDAEAMKLLEGRRERRERPAVIPSRLSIAAIEKFMPDVARAMSARGSAKGGQNRAANMTPAQRSRAARKAVKARWKQKRAARKALVEAKRSDL